MQLLRSLRVVLVGLLLFVPPALACLWDSDTLKEESIGLDEVAAVLRGRILKHSATFYERKVAYTLPLLEREDVKPERYDDLAVAYEKLGRTQEAIATLEAKEKRFPGLYTTAANLGTFHAHAGDYPRALEELRRALALNPDAHFGREKYQVKAIEYLQRLAGTPELVQKEEFLGLPLEPERYLFVMNPEKAALRKERPELPKDVLQGLVGIIRFGSGEKSPHLWFSLGISLAWSGHKNLALRAMRRAELLGHPLAREHAVALSRTIKAYSNRLPEWEALAAGLDAEWAQGQAWVQQKQRQEDALLARGKAKQVFGY
ncbi:MAG TPA: tetratricopeptide repeat protein [Archangium sp.]|uniref:tetratricopeptide repeat protein n=1 Tax=Archangium sp. TaxID=1872627 RepID=UPI002E34C931|nr:tetratricopeptide repeat protein [Archangium sp.]HEX5752357.1 tetratricopeptide repeat protein [Archangium sp.]